MRQSYNCLEKTPDTTICVLGPHYLRPKRRKKRGNKMQKTEKKLVATQCKKTKLGKVVERQRERQRERQVTKTE
jgi:hypothetical protein